MNPKLKEEFQKKLNDQLEMLLHEAQATVNEIGAETEKEKYPDVTDQATLERDRNFLLRIRDRERKLITKIKGALQRLEENAYGLCESCENPISVARLKARPITTLCIDCKTEAESKENSPWGQAQSRTAS